MNGWLLAMETESANAIFYICVAAVAVVFIICAAWVLRGWGPLQGPAVKVSDPPMWSETTVEYGPAAASSAPAADKTEEATGEQQ